MNGSSVDAEGPRRHERALDRLAVHERDSFADEPTRPPSPIRSKPKIERDAVADAAGLDGGDDAGRERRRVVGALALVRGRRRLGTLGSLSARNRRRLPQRLAVGVVGRSEHQRVGAKLERKRQARHLLGRERGDGELRRRAVTD